MLSPLPIKSVDLFITEKCNMGCEYCFHQQSDSVMDVATGKKILDRLYVLNNKSMYINFFGGEPLLYPEVVKELAEYAKTLWKSGLQFGLSTNGSFFEEGFFKWMQNNRVKFQVSCDGGPETQLKQRKVDIYDNLRKMLKMFPKLCVRLTYTPDSVGNLANNVAYLYSLGVKRIMHQAVIEANWTDDDLDQYQHQYKLLYHFKRNHRDINIEFIDKNLSIINLESISGANFCESGKTLIAVLPNGGVYPCHRAASNRIFKLGNILEGDIIRGAFLIIDKKNCGCTKSCPASETCHCCIITNYLVNKKLDEPVKNYCKLMNIEHQGAVWLKDIDYRDKTNYMLSSMGKVLMDMSVKLDELDKRTMSKSCVTCGNWDIERGGCDRCVSFEGTFVEVAPDYCCENWES